MSNAIPIEKDVVVEKPVLAVDIDDVLVHLTSSLTVYHNELYTDLVLTHESFIGHEFHKVWGGTADEAQDKVNRACFVLPLI